ncbi:MAG: ABC transporter substrate-binding protein [Thermoleophilaceae bacterium]|nr:ABC transporter substrate-binding protein [Thermoleophilaceae bacterium]
MQQIRRMLAVATAVLAAVALGACGSSNDKGSESGSGSGGGKTENVTLLMNWFAQAEQGGYWQAQAADTGKSQGISIKVLQGGPQIQTIPQVAAGKADFGVAQADELMLARAEGVPVVEVFGGMDKYLQCMMYHPSSGIKDFGDISGHQVAVAPSGGFWPWIKGHYHLQNVKEINFTGTLAEFKRNKNLVQQCFTTSEPYFADQQGIDHAELLVADAGYNPYAQGLFTSERMIKEHPDTVRKVVAAVQEGWRQFLEDPTKARDLVLSVNKDMEKGPFDFAWKTLKDGDFFGTPLGGMTAERWNTLHQQLEEAGVLTKKVDPNSVWTDEFIPKQ